MPANGNLGEDYAAKLLTDAGYALLARNFSTSRGEIDIVAQKDGVIAFVEVKTRSEGALCAPGAAVNAAKQRRIIRAAAEYLQRYEVNLQPRFDVVTVVTARGGAFCVRMAEHLEGAFCVDETNRPD